MKRALLLALLLAACTQGGSGSPAARSPGPAAVPSPTPPPVVYVAVGASETVGVGAQDPRSQAWPLVFYRTALPTTAVMYNVGIPGETTAAALTAELPAALSVQPTLATVWLNVDDLVAGVSVADYEARLGQLVHALRRGGAARVLVANTPYLDRLPLYVACQAGRPGCPFAGAVPPPATLNAMVDAYNGAIARVAQREGATLVDLHGSGEVPDAHPDYVGADGFHPSAAGHAAIAATFAAALQS
ncbi:MAG TPA: SGNH/GDSL hydrolase family protein [Candidatus Dormibacteraeota bacterium]|nr:SGNH/GDSL hydrolase family protein [Candidatus Dormibacteraeota bacterium]